MSSDAGQAGHGWRVGASRGGVVVRTRTTVVVNNTHIAAAAGVAGETHAPRGRLRLEGRDRAVLHLRALR
eukprot:3720809-Heterocapsa_arctica.AAC.1